ncbi:MAG: hypothetical protein ACI875_002541, partial [Planctomycetota bacterium]
QAGTPMAVNSEDTSSGFGFKLGGALRGHSIVHYCIQ